MSTPTISRTGQRIFDAHDGDAGAGTISLDGRAPRATHTLAAVEGTSSPQADPYAVTTTTAPAGSNTTDRGRSTSDAQTADAPVGSDSETGAEMVPPTESAPRPSLFDPTLYTLAQYLDDVEGLRKAQGNRRRILTTTEPDEDGVMRGFGLDSTHPVVATIEAQIEQLEAIEHQAILSLNRAMRKHPLAGWQKQAKGVGEKQLARLLAAIGDPYINATTGQPRTVSQLWAYSGLHVLPAGAIDDPSPEGRAPLPGAKQATGGDSGHGLYDNHNADAGVAARRRKGVQSNWSTDAKTRAYLIATSCIKQQGPYREVYLARREHTAVTRPDWTPGHSHADGLRIVSKRILRDLWRAARDYYLEEN